MSSGFYFRNENEDGVINTLTIPNSDITWHDLLVEFRRFLRGSGYVLPEDTDV